MVRAKDTRVSQVERVNFDLLWRNRNCLYCTSNTWSEVLGFLQGFVKIEQKAVLMVVLITGMPDYFLFFHFQGRNFEKSKERATLLGLSTIDDARWAYQVCILSREHRILIVILKGKKIFSILAIYFFVYK